MLAKLNQLARLLRVRRVPLFLKVTNRLVFKVDLPPSVQLSKGVRLSYSGLGTVINRRAIIGDYVKKGIGVTVSRHSHHQDVPVNVNGTMIGSGAKGSGPIRIGQFASIGAYAVVMTGIEDLAVAVGIPARVIKILMPEQMPNDLAFQSKEPEA